MTYARVIPRDLFNEGDLLNCLGRLYLKLDERRDHEAVLLFDDEAGGGWATFEVEQNPDDGSISSRTVGLVVAGEVVPTYRPLNARDKYPLYARFGDEDRRVFDLDGELSPEFWLEITEGRS